MLSCNTMEKQSDVTDVYRMQVCEYVFVPQKLVVSSRRRSARGAEASATTPTRTSARTCSSTTRVRCSLLNRNRKLFVRLYRLARLDLLTLPASPAVCLVDRWQQRRAAAFPHPGRRPLIIDPYLSPASKRSGQRECCDPRKFDAVLMTFVKLNTGSCRL